MKRANQTKMTHLTVLASTLCVVVGCTYLQAATAAVRADTPAQITAMQEKEKVATNVYEAYFPSLEIARKAAISFHEQTLETNYETGFLVMELTPQDMSKLRSFGFKFKPAAQFMKQRKSFINGIQSEGRRRIQAESSLTRTASSAKILAAPATIPYFACYETVEESFLQAQAFATAKPNLAQWIDVGDSWEKTAGLGGYDIKVLKLTNTAITGNKPKLFVNSAIHAREYATAALNLEFARWLVNGYGVNADATWILDHHEVHLMLQTNPDGRKKAEAGLAWRKNTNQNYCGATSNLRGADLNRNFTYSFNATNGQGSSSDQCAETYRGTGAASEPEIKAIEGYVRTLWPDRRGNNFSDAAPRDTSGIHIDLHSYGKLVMWPWGVSRTPAANAVDLQTMGRKMAYFTNYTPQQSIGLYPTDGTSSSISYGELGVAAFTIELGTSFFESCTNYTNTIKPSNLKSLIYAAKAARTPYITPAGPDMYYLNLSGTAGTTGTKKGTTVTLSTAATSIYFNNSNGTQLSNNIAGVEYYMDTPPWVAATTPTVLPPTDGSFNSKTEGAYSYINTSNLSVGKHTIFLRAKDTAGNWGAFSAIFLNVIP